jgi:branched-chain amino acid transport system ATP-binding protein
VSAVLEVEQLQVSYAGVPALRGVSLSVERGEIVALIGANGAGKTTLLRAVAGLVPASGGRIRVGGAEIQGTAPQAIVRRGVSLVPQDRGLFPYMTVRENLALGRFIQDGPGAGRRAAAAQRTEQVFAWFPILRERAGQRAHTLSGGEQQMLAIGRALMRQPALLMLDEPSLALAPKVVDMIGGIIETLCRSGTTILLVEQNVRMALRVAHRAYVLSTGSIVMHGPARELVDDERIRHIYLGTAPAPARAAAGGGP